MSEKGLSGYCSEKILLLFARCYEPLVASLGWATSAAISRDLLESFTQQILGERVF